MICFAFLIEIDLVSCFPWPIICSPVSSFFAVVFLLLAVEELVRRNLQQIPWWTQRNSGAFAEG